MYYRHHDQDCRRLIGPIFLLFVAACDNSSTPPTPVPTVAATATLNPNNNLSARGRSDGKCRLSACRCNQRIESYPAHAIFFGSAVTGSNSSPGTEEPHYLFTGGGSARLRWERDVNSIAFHHKVFLTCSRPSHSHGERRVNTTGYLYTSVEFAIATITGFAVAFDSTGTIVWYREFPREFWL